MTNQPKHVDRPRNLKKKLRAKKWTAKELRDVMNRLESCHDYEAKNLLEHYPECDNSTTLFLEALVIIEQLKEELDRYKVEAGK